MRIDCDIIKDLLPLYAENMVSEKSKSMVEEHLAECEDCKNTYGSMVEPAPQITFHQNEARGFEKFVKKEKRHYGWKVAVITAAVVITIVFVRLAIIGGLMGFLAIDCIGARVHEDTNVENYEHYMGKNAEEEYRVKWGMDESIFPESISPKMDVKDYKMVYYNPWDSQYLSYLVVDYGEADYQAEIKRLKNYGAEDYKGYYGVEGFDSQYQLLAMHSDAYQGFVYALTDGNHQIIYVEIIFCNYFMDINYEKYIDQSYLPVGFDATEDNPYRNQRMK